MSHQLRAIRTDPTRSGERRRSTPAGRRAAALLTALSLLGSFGQKPVLAQPDALADRRGLAEAETEPAAIARCEDLHASLTGFEQPQRRVDLWVSGALTLVHTDGVLWYLAVCSSPGIRVMCVTYSDNDMKPGDHVTFRGGFNRQDERHVVLDPCLASPP